MPHRYTIINAATAKSPLAAAAAAAAIVGDFVIANL